MTRATFIDWVFIALALALAAAAFGAWAAAPAHSHEWYSQRSDPSFNNGCCGGSDCKEFDGSLIEAEEGGYRIRLTVAQAQEVNANTQLPVDALVPWRRIQDSQDGNFHLCIFLSDRSWPREGVICLFAPPSM